MRKIITLSLFVLYSQFLFSQEIKYVNTELLNVRSGAGTKYRVIDKIANGEQVTAYSTQGTWTEVELNNGQRGYVSTKFLSDSQSSKSSSNGDDNSWMAGIFAVGFVLYVLKKSFFGGNSSSKSSSNSQTRERKTEERKNEKEKPKPQPKPVYYCEYCGENRSSISSLTISYCHRHPLGTNKGKHKLYEGSEKSKYTCKYCGTDRSSISSLTGSYCHRHPHGTNKGKHSPAL